MAGLHALLTQPPARGQQGPTVGYLGTDMCTCGHILADHDMFGSPFLPCQGRGCHCPDFTKTTGATVSKIPMPPGVALPPNLTEEQYQHLLQHEAAFENEYDEPILGWFGSHPNHADLYVNVCDTLGLTPVKAATPVGQFNCKHCGMPIKEAGDLWLAAVGPPLPMCVNGEDMHEPWDDDVAPANASGPSGDRATIGSLSITGADGVEILRFKIPQDQNYTIEVHTAEEPVRVEPS